MPYSEFKVRRGRKILITRMAEIFRLAAESDTQPRITTEKSSCDNKCSCELLKYDRMSKCTYNVPRISQVRVRLHKEAHSDDFQDHLNAKNQQEDNV